MMMMIMILLAGLKACATTDAQSCAPQQVAQGFRECEQITITAETAEPAEKQFLVTSQRALHLPGRSSEAVNGARAGALRSNVVFFHGLFTPAGAVASWADIVTRIERGAATSDVATLRSAVADAMKLADATGLDRERQLALYGAAYASWRLSTTPGVDAAESMTLLRGAENNLREVMRADPKSGEARALLASVLGLLIRAGGNKMTLGPEAQEVREEGLALEPNNPRVVLQAAITTLHTPAEYGGGADKAEGGLRQAIVLFEREPAGRPWPNWGRFDAHAWLGQVLAARGDKTGARAEYDLALGVWPQSGWVKYVLIPALNK